MHIQQKKQDDHLLDDCLFYAFMKQSSEKYTHLIDRQEQFVRVSSDSTSKSELAFSFKDKICVSRLQNSDLLFIIE